MTISKLRLLAGVVLLSTLAGCGGGSSSTPVAMTPAKQEDQFGAKFGAAYRADPNATAIEPADGDIAPVSLTTEPIDVK